MKQNNKKFNNAMHKFFGVLDKCGKIMYILTFSCKGHNFYFIGLVL